MSDNSQNQEPSLIGGHAQYVKGAAEVSFHSSRTSVSLGVRSHLRR